MTQPKKIEYANERMQIIMEQIKFLGKVEQEIIWSEIAAAHEMGMIEATRKESKEINHENGNF